MFYLANAFLVAFCSMSYELILAQSITILYGSTVLNYTLIIGIYIFSLGMGAALHARRTSGGGVQWFWRIELLLSVAGGLSPFLILLTELLIGKSPYDLVTPAAALVAVGIGILSGMEIPVIIEIAVRDRKLAPQEQTNTLIRNIIGLDFIGTFVAAAVVPLVCFPFIGVLRTAALTACINGIILTWFVWRFRSDIKPVVLAGSLVVFAALVVLTVKSGELGQHLFRNIF